jgi:putative membrane protein
MKLSTVALALALFIPTISGAQDATPNPDQPKDKPADKAKPDKKEAKKLGEAEQKIISHVHHVNVMEIDVGKLAQRVGTAPVKKLAEMIVIDHQMSDKALTKLAKENGMANIPAMKPTSEAEKQAHKDMQDQVTALKKLKGADFDRAYLQMMVKGHEEELAKTDPFIEQSQNSDLDMFLQNRKATLQRHADAAKELEKAGSVSQKQP